MSTRAMKWKEGKLISIEILDGLYTLAQMLVEPYLVFFNSFVHENEWRNKLLSEEDVLFCHAITRQFLKKTKVYEQPDIKPLNNYSPPQTWLHVTGAKKIRVILPVREIEIVLLAEEKLVVEKDILKVGKYDHPSGVYDKAIEQVNNIKQANDYELTTVEIYPNINERLRLCHLFGKNVDPIKEIIFEEKIPNEYEVFVGIISGLIPLKELGY